MAEGRGEVEGGGGRLYQGWEGCRCQGVQLGWERRGILRPWQRRGREGSKQHLQH